MVSQTKPRKVPTRKILPLLCVIRPEAADEYRHALTALESCCAF